MSPEERPEQVETISEYVEDLLNGRKPATPRDIRAADAELLHTAAMLASVESPQAQPSAAFVEQLRAQLTGGQRRWWNIRISRRGMAGGFASGAVALAAVLAGQAGWQRFVARSSVPAGWVPVAQAADLPPGSVKPFTAGTVQGHVMNIGGKVWALSAICTHLACTLQWQPQQQEFLCPCHGAEFDTTGQQTGVDGYGLNLPPLPRIPVQQLNGTVYVIPT